MTFLLLKYLSVNRVFPLCCRGFLLFLHQSQINIHRCRPSTLNYKDLMDTECNSYSYFHFLSVSLSFSYSLTLSLCRTEHVYRYIFSVSVPRKYNWRSSKEQIVPLLCPAKVERPSSVLYIPLFHWISTLQPFSQRQWRVIVKNTLGLL